ncbi:MAG: hypothetical protein HYZ28_06255 [Myxococcales bacterium]|nr:hypothetical protein [Myxococcales bacterium]
MEAAGVEYALGGSVATGLQGEPRATNDVDFAVRLSEQQVSRLATELGPDFAVDEEGLREAVRRRGSDNIFFLPSALKIDLFVRGGEPFDDSELSRRRLQPIRGDDRAWIATPEDNILRKLVWFRKGGEVSDRQWRDVLGILRLPGHVLDWDYLRQWAPRLGVADLLERVASQA